MILIKSIVFRVTWIIGLITRWSLLFIDDRIENVQVAKNLGIDSIQFCSPEQLKAELEKRGFYLDSMAEQISFKPLKVSK